jgi:hypothetical protein
MSHDKVYDPKEPNMVYLRPNEGARPIAYESSTNLQGLMLDRKHAIAVYTSRAGMAVGPAGPMPDVYDTIIASCSDEFTPLTVGGPKTTFRAPFAYDMTTGFVRASLTDAVTGSPLEIDILMNGVSIFSGANYLTIDAGSRTSVGSVSPPVYNFPGNAVPDDAEFLVQVISIGSSFAGAGLKVALTGMKIPV